ncbi:hypothetical protein CC78DRAFT_541356 [Lojkania enalia]|uniref:Uncharacterized protein n=1 Tax=Lojkania enalia TaxID=147567 RepID=A0A9P4KGG9_9PLEO|nr:hypothetical protein CC78DRAFT_541356 [Didymosphaeria enalia]
MVIMRGTLTNLRRCYSDGDFQVTTRDVQDIKSFYDFHRNLEIREWCNNLPSNTTFKSPHTGDSPTASIYHDWLDMQARRGMEVLTFLDDLEKWYRVIGLRYHTLPIPLRRLASPNVRARLAQVFEPEEPRSKQPFFATWYTILEETENLFSLVHSLQHVNDKNVLKRVYKEKERVLKSGEEEVMEIRRRLMAIDELVERLPTNPIVAELDLDEAEFELELKIKFSQRGSLLRGWIWSFEEVQRNPGHGLIEAIVEEFLGDSGVGAGPYWSGLVDV